MREIYLDNAATTYTEKEVLDAMLPYFYEDYGNPDSLHSKGIKAKEAIDNARRTIAKYLNCSPSEIIFTGSGTEANNIAILGVARANKRKGTHLITSEIEHSSVLKTFEHLEAQESFKVTYLKPDKNGIISPKELEKAITKETILVSLMYANNEIGTIQDIGKFGEICRDKKILYHTDACQANGTFALDTKKLKIDLMTINGSKVYGPKGIGALFIKKGTPIVPITFGGVQEMGLRSGTMNTANVIGLAKALEIAERVKSKENKKLSDLRDKLIKKLLEKIKGSKLNGDSVKRLPNNINISIPGINGKELLLHLSERGIYISTGSACTSTFQKASHVLMALGLSEELAESCVRITLGRKTTEADVNEVAKILPEIVSKIRKK